MQEHNVETWARCEPCTLWFSIPSDTVEALVSTRCTRCGAAPGQLEQRLGNLVIALELDVGEARPDAPLQGVA